MKYILVFVIFLVGCSSAPSKEELQCADDGGQFHDNICWNKRLPQDIQNSLWLPLKERIK